jgi:hypothetical protein
MSKRGAPKAGEIRLITKAEHKAIQQYGGRRSMYIGNIPESNNSDNISILTKKGTNYILWESINIEIMLKTLFDFWGK